MPKGDPLQRVTNCATPGEPLPRMSMTSFCYIFYYFIIMRMLIYFKFFSHWRVHYNLLLQAALLCRWTPHATIPKCQNFPRHVEMFVQSTVLKERSTDSSAHSSWSGAIPFPTIVSLLNVSYVNIVFIIGILLCACWQLYVIYKNCCVSFTSARCLREYKLPEMESQDHHHFLWWKRFWSCLGQTTALLLPNTIYNCPRDGACVHNTS